MSKWIKRHALPFSWFVFHWEFSPVSVHATYNRYLPLTAKHDLNDDCLVCHQKEG
jgi:hypothetical protein